VEIRRALQGNKTAHISTDSMIISFAPHFLLPLTFAWLVKAGNDSSFFYALKDLSLLNQDSTGLEEGTDPHV
jgi:hypothetical protein